MKGEIMLCENCIFFEFIQEIDEEPDGYCHRFPPTRPTISDFDLFPCVCKKDWCGEYKQKSTELTSQ